MTSARRKRGGGGEGGSSEMLIRLTLGEGGDIPYKVDTNHDALKGWGKEKPK